MLDYPTRTDRVGLKYLQWYGPHNVWHPGIDFNFGNSAYADFRQDVIPPTWGVVEYVSPRGTNGGLGNYLVLYHPTHKVWTRYLHLEDIFVKAAQKTPPKQTISLLGDSGTDTSHLHFEVLNEKGLAFIRDWSRPYGRYPTGLSKAKVASMWIDPDKWIRESEHPKPNERVKWEKQLELAVKALDRASPSRKALLQRMIERLVKLLG